MWYDPKDRLRKAMARYEEGDLSAAQAMLRALDRRGVVSPRIDLYLGHCHLEADRPRAAIRRYLLSSMRAPQDAGPWVGLGLCYGRMGDLERAARAFRRAARLAPNLEEAHCNLVHCYGLLGRLERAKVHARRVLEIDPRCPRVHRHLAIAYLMAGEPARALEEWRRAAAADPADAEQDVGIARCLAALGRVAEARVRFVRALAGDYAAEAQIGLGDLARARGDLAEAEEHYARAAPDVVTGDLARLKRAQVLVSLGRPDAAHEALGPLRDAVPADPEVTWVAASALNAGGASAEGLRILRACVAQRPTDAARWTRLGEYLLLCERPRIALTVLEVSRRLDPTGIEAVRLCARALARSRGPRAATSLLARAVHRSESPVDLAIDVAALHLAAGRSRAAERSLLRTLVRHPREAPLWAAVAELALDGGRRQVARDRLRHALRCDPRHASALGLLARWWMEAGEPLRAAHAARAAVRLLPPDDRTLRDLGAALLLVGRREEAALHLRRYVLAAPGDPLGYGILAQVLDAMGDPLGADTQRRLARAVTPSGSSNVATSSPVGITP